MLVVGSKVILKDGSVGQLKSYKDEKFNFRNKSSKKSEWIQENEILKQLPDKAGK